MKTDNCPVFIGTPGSSAKTQLDDVRQVWFGERDGHKTLILRMPYRETHPQLMMLIAAGSASPPRGVSVCISRFAALLAEIEPFDHDCYVRAKVIDSADASHCGAIAIVECIPTCDFGRSC